MRRGSRARHWTGSGMHGRAAQLLMRGPGASAPCAQLATLETDPGWQGGMQPCPYQIVWRFFAEVINIAQGFLAHMTSGSWTVARMLCASCF